MEEEPQVTTPSRDQGNRSFIILISCIATIGGFLFGFDSGVINGTVDGLRKAFNSDSVGTGFSVASMLLGCAVGAATAGRLADLYGRRAMLISAAVLFCRPRINTQKCTGCAACAAPCPVDGISGEKKDLHTIDAAVCIKCGVCSDTCTFGAVETVQATP